MTTTATIVTETLREFKESLHGFTQCVVLPVTTGIDRDCSLETVVASLDPNS